MSTVPTDPQTLWFELMQFYTEEAYLLDDRKLEEWLNLLADDILYFMPRRKNVLRRDAFEQEFTKLGELNFFEENKRLMTIRVKRLQTDMAWAEDPPSRTTHLIGNLLISPGSASDEIQAKTSFIVMKTHLETNHDTYSGFRHDVLRKGQDGWKIAKRTIFLNANVLLYKNISIFF